MRPVLVVLPLPPPESHHVLYGWIALDDIHHLGELLAHGLKRNILRRLNVPEHATGVLLREKPFGNDDVKVDAEHHGDERHSEHAARMPQHPGQARRVSSAHPFEEPFARADTTSRVSSALDLNILAHIMGVVVSETTSETRIATERVTANSRNSRPTMPPMKRIGRKTATSDSVIDKTVKVISFAPRKAASSGAMPCSRYRLMFSRTTIASSTTKPVAMVSAISDRLSRL